MEGCLGRFPKVEPRVKRCVFGAFYCIHPGRSMSTNPRSTARIAGHPLHIILVPIPITCFLGTLVTDIAYAETANTQWANMSAWLLTVGLIVALFAVIAGFIDFLGDRRIRDLRAVWIHAIGNAIALIL